MSGLAALAAIHTSCPHLLRASTSSCFGAPKDVDGRNKSGHDRIGSPHERSDMRGYSKEVDPGYRFRSSGLRALTTDYAKLAHARRKSLTDTASDLFLRHLRARICQGHHRSIHDRGAQGEDQGAADLIRSAASAFADAHAELSNIEVRRRTGAALRAFA